MKYPFTYIVVYYYYDKDTKKNKYFRESGIGFAENYAEAAHILVAAHHGRCFQCKLHHSNTGRHVRRRPHPHC